MATTTKESGTEFLADSATRVATAVVIGRFQIFHSGHLHLLRQALAMAEHLIIVLGSAQQARTPRNPFSWQERAAMIRLCLSEHELQRVHFLPLRDYYQQDLWVQALQQQVQQIQREQAWASGKLALFGYNKDFTSEYLHAFPQWQLCEVDFFQRIDAHALRQVLFDSDDVSAALAVIQAYVPETILNYLRSWCLLPYFSELQQEYAYLKAYQKSWSLAPYPPIFTTVDNLVRVNQHVLLIRRGGYPCKGSWAIPGGFVDQHERLQVAAIRELREETGLAVLPEVLKAALQTVEVFDHPQRSQRGRTITHTHYFYLNQENLPEICASDDAAAAVWMPISRLPELEAEFCDDHFQMLNFFLHLNLQPL